jgi:protein-S-isoprenylcysteine O-methyltransferase Ste14
MSEAIRWTERAFLLLLSGGVIWRMLPEFSLHPHIVLVLASEIAGVIFVLFQRKGTWATSAYTTAIAFLGTAFPLLVAAGGTAIAPNNISMAFVIFGTGIALVAKLSLRRSFGLVPANRGVKSGGAYRFVRHPMYTGYVFNHIGMLMTFFSAWNVAVYAAAWLLLYLRAIEEEKFLLTDPEYAAYANKVKGRIVPGLV